MDEGAKDILYMHDTIETFAARPDELRGEWANIGPELHVNSVRIVQRAASSIFGAVTDPIRAASRILAGRALTPELILEACNLGLTRIFQREDQED